MGTYSSELKVFNTKTMTEVLDEKDTNGIKINAIAHANNNDSNVILGMDNGAIKLLDLNNFNIVKE